MKRRFSLCLGLILLLCACLPALAETAQPSPSSALPSMTDHLFLLFGSEEAAVLDALNHPSILETEERRSQRTLLLDCPEDSFPAAVRLTFYNGILMACEYEFDSHETAYLFSKDALNDLTVSLGEKTTYPGVVVDSRGYLSELTDSAELQELFAYYEDWTPEIDEAVVRQMIGDIDYSRVDLQLELSVYPENHAVVSMKYIVIRSSLR